MAGPPPGKKGVMVEMLAAQSFCFRVSIVLDSSCWTSFSIPLFTTAHYALVVLCRNDILCVCLFVSFFYELLSLTLSFS